MQMPREIGTFHIIGIGGIGMSAIAEILLAKGYSVQGSDQKDSANVRRLRAKGVRVFIGHDGVNLVGARSVVISSAVKPGNPELEAARARGLPVSLDVLPGHHHFSILDEIAKPDGALTRALRGLILASG